MSEKIEFDVTEGMLAAFFDKAADYCIDSGIAAALAHPSFQSQLRAYVAGEMRKVVPEIQVPPAKYDATERYGIACHNQCRDTTLANIAAYEKEQEDGK